MLMRSEAPMVQLVENTKCLCGRLRGGVCVCWEHRLHANPDKAKHSARNGQLTVSGEPGNRASER